MTTYKESDYTRSLAPWDVPWVEAWEKVVVEQPDEYLEYLRTLLPEDHLSGRAN